MSNSTSKESSPSNNTPIDPFINYSHPSDQKLRANKNKATSLVARKKSRKAELSRDKQALIPQTPTQHTPPWKVSSSQAAFRVISNHNSATTQIQSDSTQQPESTSSALSKSSSLIRVPTAKQSLSHDHHGLREDPFSAYPIEHVSDNIGLFIDHYLDYYAVHHMFRPHILPKEQGPAEMRRFLKHAMQRPIMFEGIVALGAISLSRSNFSYPHLRHEGLSYYGRALKKLQQLETDEFGNDSTLAAIMSLLDITQILADFQAHEMHLSAMQHCLNLIGGLQNVTLFPSILKPWIPAHRAISKYISKTLGTVSDFIGSRKGPQTIDAPENLALHYALDAVSSDTLLFSSERSQIKLRTAIAGMRGGFHALAVEGNLSAEVCGLVWKITMNDLKMDRMNGGPSEDAAVMEQMEYVQKIMQSPMRQTEQILCIATIAHLMEACPLLRRWPCGPSLAKVHISQLSQLQPQSGSLASDLRTFAFCVLGRWLRDNSTILTGGVEGENKHYLRICQMEIRQQKPGLLSSWSWPIFRSFLAHYYFRSSSETSWKVFHDTLLMEEDQLEI